MFQRSATHSLVHINAFKETDKWADVQAERGDDVVIMLVGNKIEPNKSYSVTTIFSAIPRDQSLWGKSTMLCLLRGSYQCQASERSWV